MSLWKWKEVQEVPLSKLTKEWVSKKLPHRPKDANKGTFGKVLAIAGSENYPGAAYLCCAASYRVGAGLVTLATTEVVKIIVSRKLPEVTFLSYKEVLEEKDKYDVILLGPGLGQKDRTAQLVKKLLDNSLPPTIIDGDGLNILSKMDKLWGRVNKNLVLTPHPGEMSRLSGLTIERIQSAREEMAMSLSKKWGQTVVLKGANTVIASPGREAVVSPFANPALATAGTGDILSGMIAGFIAQGLNNFDASICSVFIHGLAAELLKKDLGNAGVMASDLLPKLPVVLKSLTQQNQT